MTRKHIHKVRDGFALRDASFAVWNDFWPLSLTLTLTRISPQAVESG